MPDNKKISELLDDPSPTLTDYIAITSGGKTYKVNLAKILALSLNSGSGGTGGTGNMLDQFTINVPGDPFKANNHTVNIGDNISGLLKLLLSPTISASISAGTSNTNVALKTGLTIGLTATETPGTYPIATRLWSVVSGPTPLTIGTPDQKTATLSGFTTTSAGTYIIKYHTVDTNGLIVDDTVSELVVYNPPAIAVTPVILQLPATSGSLAASTTITAGSYPIQSTVYSLVTGPAGIITASGTFTGFNTAGSYTCNILVTDVNGHTASTNITVTVTAAAIVPIPVYYGTTTSNNVLTQTQIEAAAFIAENPGAVIYVLPFPGATANPSYHWFAEKLTEPIKTNGADVSDPNNTFGIGSPTDTFGPPVTVGPYRFYITTYATALNPTNIKI